MQETTYQPKIIRGRIKIPLRDWTEYREEYKGQGFTVNGFKAMQKSDQYFNGLELHLSSWQYDHHSCWHLWSWAAEDDERVMLAMYHAEQYKLLTAYKDNFDAFVKDWKNGEYDPGAVYTFKLEEVEVLEVLQEEVDNIDHEKTRKKAEREKKEIQRRRDTKKKYRPKYRR